LLVILVEQFNRKCFTSCVEKTSWGNASFCWFWCSKGKLYQYHPITSNIDFSLRPHNYATQLK